MPVGDIDRTRTRPGTIAPNTTGGSNGFLDMLMGSGGFGNQAQMSPAPTQANVYSPETLGLLQQLQAMAMNPAQANQSPFTQMQYPQSYPSMQQGYPTQGLLSGLINRW